MTALAIMRLVPKPGRIEAGEPHRSSTGRDLTVAVGARDALAVRGARIGMIFQEPMTSLNPVTTVGGQVIEAIDAARNAITRALRASACIELFALVGIPDPRSRFWRLSAPALRRAQAAGDDRHGHGHAPAPADRRRADHGARCHHPRADPGAAARPLRQDRHGGAAHHPRLRRGQRGGGPRGRHVRGPDRRGRARAWSC